MNREPESLQDQLLRACFGEEDEARLALEICSGQTLGRTLHPDLGRILPLLYRRWPQAVAGSGLIEQGHRAYLTTWGQNQQRLLCVASIAAEFEQAGIPTLFLKGVALTLGHYRDNGVRYMDDFDLLVHEGDVEPAALLLQRLGWQSNTNCGPSAIVRLMRTRHYSWHFFHGSGQNCDLHGRCYSPEVTRLLWQGAETVILHGRPVKIPCPTDLLFHVCVHGLLQPPPVRWVADALTVLHAPESIDWDRLHRLACAANFQVLLYEGLQYLRSAWKAPIPQKLLARWFDTPAPAWERREYRLLLKLGVIVIPGIAVPNRPRWRRLFDSAVWHAYHFHRIRQFDAGWRRMPAILGFRQYLEAFQVTPGWPAFFRTVWSRLRAEAKPG